MAAGLFSIRQRWTLHRSLISLSCKSRPVKNRRE
jgi:hypothetical protein